MLRGLASRSALALSLLATLSCGSEQGDRRQSIDVPSPAGKDKRFQDIGNPNGPDHVPHNTPDVRVSGAVVIAIDKFDETGNGKSQGTIYVQDINSREPYSGLSLFAPTFVPGNLHVEPGDVIDLRGTYQENTTVPIPFAPGWFLPQLSQPTATFRFEHRVPDPVDIDIKELEDFGTGRKWLNMIVRVKNVTVQRDVTTAGSGRASAELLPGKSPACEEPGIRPPTITNALFDVGALNLKGGQTLKSLTGVVTFFCNLHISPRSAADVEQ